jgi:TRAP-type C4-dicarboxylate transport system permease small subunit
MNFKQFLKPDWRKIVVFIGAILISAFGIYPRIYRSVVKYCLVALDPETCSNPRLKALERALDISMKWSPAILILSYLLSCLIIWVYEKLKKKS